MLSSIRARHVAVTLAALCAAFFSSSTPTRAETPLERGTYLVRSIVACGNCHTPKGPTGDLPGMEFAGWPEMDKSDAMIVSAPNITQDRETGIGAWSDAQIIAAIREGKRPDGTIIGPPMPIGLYRGLSDTDVKAIVAYLRTVKPIRAVVPKSTYNIPLPPAYGPPVADVPDVDPADKIAYGAYLAGPLGHCIECHTPMGPTGPDLANRLGAGGFEFHGPWGTSVSANITPTGLADRSDADIIRMITTGTRPDGSPMLPPMGYAYYANIKPADLEAIVSYLRSLPPK